MMHTFLRLFLQTALLMTAGLSQAAVTPPKPNIILIYADDMGMGLLGCYGESLVKTPNIDRLAEQGVMFTRCYSSQYCCPARAPCSWACMTATPNPTRKLPEAWSSRRKNKAGAMRNLNKRPPGGQASSPPRRKYSSRKC